MGEHMHRPFDIWNNIGRTATWLRSGFYPSDGWIITDTEPSDDETRYKITHPSCLAVVTVRLSDLTNLI